MARASCWPARAPGTAAYNNTVIHNQASGNGLAGVVIHAHYTGGEYLQGNKIIREHDRPQQHHRRQPRHALHRGDFATTGILVFSAMPISVLVSHNTISRNTDGIWATPNVTLHGQNTFTKEAHACTGCGCCSARP